jgi:photosystem II stability/assembly factor-like uncharacterized protein
MPLANQVFISYRRSDSSGHARFLYRYLAARFRPSAVFFDQSSIEEGSVFPRRISGAITQSQVVLVLIGPDWLTAKNAGGRRRLDDERDVVRQEVSRALALRKPVVPVLFDDAPMPRADQLPAPLVRLASIDALTLRGKSDEYDRQLARLAELVAEHVKGADPRLARRFGAWTLASPSWAFFRALERDPRAPASFYAGLDEGQGLFHSEDGGRSWDLVDPRFANESVNSIATSRSGDVVLVGTDAGLLESRDGGRSWTERPEFARKAVLSVAVSPFDSDVEMAGCQHAGGTGFSAGTSGSVGEPVGSVPGTLGRGLKVTRDAGASWITYSIPETVNGIWLDDEDSRLALVASIDEGLFLSRDGDTFRRVDAFPMEQGPACAVVVHGDRRRMLVGTRRAGVWLSDDDGDHWQQADGIPPIQVSDILRLPGGPGRLGAATPSGYYESQDGGRHWRPIDEGLTYRFCMAASAIDDGSVVVGTSGGGAYRLAAGSSIWNPASQGFPPAAALRAFWDRGGLLLLTPIGVFRSVDDGDSWRLLGPPPEGLVSMATDAPGQGSRAPARGGLHRSRAGGPWRAAPSGDATRLLYVGTRTGSLFRSRDGGTSWDRVALPAARAVRAILVGAEGALGVVVEGAGFFRSADDGQTWSKDPDSVLGPLVQDVIRSPRGDRLFAKTVDRGLFWAPDDGGPWTRCAGIPEDEGLVVFAEPDDDSGLVFAATLAGSVFRSDDRGVTFGKVGDVPFPSVRKGQKLRWVALAAPTGGRAPATLVVGGVGGYVSTDGGRRWRSLPIGRYLNGYRVNDVAVSDDGATVAIATTVGLFTRTLPTELPPARSRRGKPSRAKARPGLSRRKTR